MPESSPAFIFVTSLLVGFSGSLIPGPMLAMDISESARHGFRAGPLLIAGHAAAELLLVVALLLGLSRIINLPWLTAAVSLVGGGFLLWMASGIIRTGRKEPPPSAGAGGASGAHRRTIVAGVLLSILNPTWLVWWATIGVTFVVWSMQQGALGPVYFFSGHILADFSWYSLVAFLVARGRNVFSGSVYRWLLVGSGLFLVALGGYFVYNGGKGVLSSLSFWVIGLLSSDSQ
ncbi:MAG: LysE family transporter [Chloroflexi bacterium]|nr:LysE family transporter [Chloroflexota bacterium]